MSEHTRFENGAIMAENAAHRYVAYVHCIGPSESATDAIIELLYSEQHLSEVLPAMRRDLQSQSIHH